MKITPKKTNNYYNNKISNNINNNKLLNNNNFNKTQYNNNKFNNYSLKSFLLLFTAISKQPKVPKSTFLKKVQSIFNK